MLMDEMHIKENVTFKGGRLIGHINYGTSTESVDNLPKAMQVLVLCWLQLIPIGKYQ